VLVILVLLSPLGLYLPAKLGAGTAWGEWSTDEITKIAGYVPHGIRDVNWKAPIPDYAAPGHESAPLQLQSVDYIIAGVIGIAVITLLVYVLKPLIRRRNDEGDPAVDAPIDDN
jgi:hypothetical protein